MADYINRDSVIELSREYYSQGLKEEAVPVRTIKNIPSADVVEVVRCKDCSHAHKTSFPSELRICLTTGCFHSENHFCSDGKRMDGECGYGYEVKESVDEVMRMIMDGGT